MPAVCLPAERLLSIAIMPTAAWLLPAPAAFQILYKLTTLISVSALLDVRNPVPWFNLGISTLHAVMLGLL